MFAVLPRDTAFLMEQVTTDAGCTLPISFCVANWDAPLTGDCIVLTEKTSHSHCARSIGVRFLGMLGVLSAVLTACTPPSPTQTNLPTLPAVLDITPAPTLDTDATATAFASQLRPTLTPAGLYVVQDGDTLSSLAEQFNITVEEILVANNLTDPNALQVGQALIIPARLRTPLAETPVNDKTVTTSVTQTP